VLVPKRRRRVIFGQARKQLGPIFHALAKQKECQIIAGYLMPDQVHMCIALPPKHPAASVIGFLKGKVPSLWPSSAARKETSPVNTSGPVAMQYQPSGSNWSRSARTSASRRRRMEQVDNSESSNEARIARRLNLRTNRP